MVDKMPALMLDLRMSGEVLRVTDVRQESARWPDYDDKRRNLARISAV
jgi:hypothetical protein